MLKDLLHRLKYFNKEGLPAYFSPLSIHFLILSLNNNYSLMKGKTPILISLLAAILIFTSAMHKPYDAVNTPATVKHYLYVAVPGIRDYLGYGGHGILVFDIDDHH